MWLAARRQAVLFAIAVQFLTRLPTPLLSGFDPRWLSRSTRYFPLVGVVIGGINVIVWRLAGSLLPPPVSIGLMMGASLLATGAFHEDGFADACDGFGGGHTPEQVLDIMKDSRIGAYGAIGIAMMLGLKWTALAALPASVLSPLIIGSHMMSRWCATALIWRLPYVRADAAAQARPFAQGLSGGDWLAGGAIGAVAAAAVTWITAATSGGMRVAWAPLMPVLIVAACAAAVITATAAVYFRQRIGGHTGDCLGAVQQLSELGFLIGGLAALRAFAEPGAA